MLAVAGNELQRGIIEFVHAKEHYLTPE
jgi:hypothetical protein